LLSFSTRRAINLYGVPIRLNDSLVLPMPPFEEEEDWEEEDEDFDEDFEEEDDENDF